MDASNSPKSETWRVTPDLLAVVDTEGHFVETNPAWLNTLGWSPADYPEKAFVDFLHPDDVEATLAVFDGLQSGEPVLYYENRYRKKDGGYRWLSWVAAREDDFFYCSARDVTDSKERDRSLKTFADEALLREQFIGILGHDLRNPLAAINAAVRLAQRADSDEKLQQMLGSINDSSRRMTDLINDLMDFTRARLGQGITVDPVQLFDLQDRLERVIDEVRLAHPKSRIKVIYDFDEPVVGDPARIEQLVSNLVANAVTHGAPGRTIKVSARGEDGQFILSVHNYGDPIPDAVRPRLFEAFSRVDDDNSLQGLGLGLFIANQIARAHGGTLSVETGANGTTFTFRLNPRGSEQT